MSNKKPLQHMLGGIRLVIVTSLSGRPEQCGKQEELAADGRGLQQSDPHQQSPPEVPPLSPAQVLAGLDLRGGPLCQVLSQGESRLISSRCLSKLCFIHSNNDPESPKQWQCLRDPQYL